MFQVMMAMQPREGTGGGVSREDHTTALAADMERTLLKLQCYDAAAVAVRHPTAYSESLNTVLAQEAQR
jgi:Dynein heavy chain C-terminal domain